MLRPAETRSRVITCSGARAAERRLLEEIDRVAATGPEDLCLPVRIVVPSRSLRRHLLRTLAGRRKAVAGVQVQTLFGLALEAVSRVGLAAPRADAGFEVQVRRLAAGETVIRANLDDLADGYDAVVGAVRDLLDAGFLPGNEDGVLERLEDAASEVAPERIERSRALVRLASGAFETAEAIGLRRSMRALQMAEEAWLVHGPELLPTRALFVHGFADVTGLAADLLVTLVRVLAGTVVLDRPPDPAAPGEADLGGAYLSRLEERMAHLDQEVDARTDPLPTVELGEAPDEEAEARWVAERIRSLLEEGRVPEEIGVVGRGIETLALPLRRHFRRLGIPFSGEGVTVRGAGPLRRLGRLADLLQRGSACEVDRWMETRAGHVRSTELLLGLRVLGIVRLSDLAEFSARQLPETGVALPIAVGVEEDPDREDVSSRHLPREIVERAVIESGQLVSVLEGWPAYGTARAFMQHTGKVLTALGWDEESSERRAVHDDLSSLCGELPGSFDLSRGEWMKLLSDRLQLAGEVPLGGGGAGVQVLTVMESRARTFSHLMIVGVNRGVFPRVGHEDPMLPEAVRSRLAADVLPEMPVKGRSADEERYLFAQLMSSAPSISLSWHVFGADGTVTPSSFVDRLRLREGVEDPNRIQQIWTADEAPTRPRPAYELAVLDAPAAGIDGLAALLEVAVAEGRRDSAFESSVSAAELSAARADVAAAIERPAWTEDPSPWFGFSGTGGGCDSGPIWVTQAEKIGICPWRAFLARRLGIQPMPDPLLGLPGLDGPMVGSVVHGVLEAIIIEAVDNGGDFDAVLARGAVDVRWPDRARFDALLLREAERVAWREGLAPMRMAPLLAARARQFLEVERDLEWASGTLGEVLGSEVEGQISIVGLDRPLAFRADRVDGSANAPVLVDYKAAKPAVEASREPDRTNNITRSIARGRLLQGAAYSQAGQSGNGSGRYLYLKPGEKWSDAVRQIVIGGSDEALVETFATAVRTIAAAQAEGIAFPRVEEADGTGAKHCGYCAVKEACRRQDSGFRRDLVRWMQGPEDAGRPDADAARALWWLGFDRPEGVA
jgi:hypothetical protein